MANIEPTRPLNSTAAALLGLLEDQDTALSGWDLVALAQDRIGDFWTLTQSQVYRELTAMHRGGLVAKGAVEARERTPYRITDAGRVAFGEWLAREPGPDTIRVPLLLTLAFSNHIEPGRLDRIIAEHREIHSRRLADYLAQADGPELPTQQRITLDFGIGYEHAVLAWFDRLPELLNHQR